MIKFGFILCQIVLEVTTYPNNEILVLKFFKQIFRTTFQKGNKIWFDKIILIMKTLSICLQEQDF